jgi:hypothetical protein
MLFERGTTKMLQSGTNNPLKTTSIKNINRLEDLKIAPSPASAIINIYSAKFKKAHVSMFLITGQEVLRTDFAILSVEGLPIGQYLVRVINDLYISKQLVTI